MSSTYKPVFLRALLDVGDLHDLENTKKLIGSQWLERKDGKILVDLNFIAIRFAKYYWDMEYSFRLKQSQDPQDANITRLIRAIHEPRKKPPTIKELSTEKMGDFRAKVISRSIKPEVLVHLRTDMKGLYEKTGANAISLDADIIEFLHTHKIVLRKGLSNVLTKYLEKLNRMTPQIANKIDCESRNRCPLKAEIQLAMRRWQKSKCFYCSKEFQRAQVDHVIPYNYVFATYTYNCTLACQQCNCIKSDMLPNEDLFCTILERNRDIADYLKAMNLSYNEKSYIRLFDACVEEYSNNRFFSPVKV